MRVSVEVPEVEGQADGYGPCMKALHPRWRAFVLNYLSNGGNGLAAAEAAGYSVNPKANNHSN